MRKLLKNVGTQDLMFEAIIQGEKTKTIAF